MITKQTLEKKSLEYYLNLKYSISIIPEKGGGFTALIPDLPGCMTQGETIEEVVANIEEARQLWIEAVYFSEKKRFLIQRFRSQNPGTKDPKD